ncbi:undecaprenyldiphospho-muramoylpentapeptide beta-N-acetylglucosaminyltransferase [Gilvimarinus sp. F26214L]|uniref:undecaprenyldiphospho-muramoylpentapeptide beta-N-acetylglucosaminyltransferase n=1 Tax=Gilvimarinus sp. DZF01 TaxID=3461371 RepID=UPI0040463CBF
MAAERVLIMAGGTGGHVFPALAVASELMAQGVAVEWLGTARGIEADLVPKANIKLHYLSIAGLRGKGPKAWFSLPVKLSTAVWQALGVIRTFKPDVVLGLGGFASGPGGLAARLAGIPLVIHEQNAVAGTTNRWLAKIAQRRLAAFPVKLPAAEQVGNPVRKDISALPEPQQRLAGHTGRRRLLVLGGSLGALKLNQLLPQVLADMDAEDRPDVWHQTGPRHLQVTLDGYADANLEGRVEPFIENMAEAYGWADLVLCRAGALTVSEITAAGIAAFFVPYPYAIDDHQTLNARWLVDNQAAVLMQERDMDAERLSAELKKLLASPEHLLEMAVNARKLAHPEAATRVARICMEAANG